MKFYAFLALALLSAGTVFGMELVLPGHVVKQKQKKGIQEITLEASTQAEYNEIMQKLSNLAKQHPGSVVAGKGEKEAPAGTTPIRLWVKPKFKKPKKQGKMQK